MIIWNKVPISIDETNSAEGTDYWGSVPFGYIYEVTVSNIIKKVSNQTWASIKKIGGIILANIKKIGGVSSN